MPDYWIRPTTGCWAPRRIAIIVPDLDQSGCDPIGHSPVAAVGWHAVAAMRSRGRWGAVTVANLRTRDELWDWLEDWADEKRTNYVFAPGVGHCLTLLRFWDQLDSEGARWDGCTRPAEWRTQAEGGWHPFHVAFMVLNGTTDILRYTRKDKTYSWCGLGQYLPGSEEEIATLIGYQWSGQLAPWFPGGAIRRPAGERAAMWFAAVKHLIEWWLGIKGGPWGLTTGALALSYWRSRLLPKTVLSHCDEDVKRLELDSLFGGRATTWFLGETIAKGTDPDAIKERPAPPSYAPEISRLNHFDFRSLYPSLLIDHLFPVRLLRYRSTYTVKDVADLLKHYAVIARVDLCARTPEYPVRGTERISYPLGEFRTTLTGPELVEAIRRDEVVRIVSAAMYAQDRPFRDFSSELVKLRQVEQQAGNQVWESFLKLLVNSFGGKMSQRDWQWRERPDHLARIRWGSWTEIRPPAACPVRYRAVSGLTWEHVLSELTGRPMGAAYSYLTALGRKRMRLVREQLPRETVVSQDTDGIWTLDAAREVIFSLPDLVGSEPGQLKEVDRCDYGRWFDPKHYLTSKGWVWSGYCEPAFDTARGTIRDHSFQNPVLGASEAPPGFIVRAGKETRLAALTVDGTPSFTGWVRPLVRSANEPAAPAAAASVPPARLFES